MFQVENANKLYESVSACVCLRLQLFHFAKGSVSQEFDIGQMFNQRSTSKAKMMAALGYQTLHSESVNINATRYVRVGHFPAEENVNFMVCRYFCSV